MVSSSACASPSGSSGPSQSPDAAGECRCACGMGKLVAQNHTSAQAMYESTPYLPSFFLPASVAAMLVHVNRRSRSKLDFTALCTILRRFVRPTSLIPGPEFNRVAFAEEICGTVTITGMTGAWTGAAYARGLHETHSHIRHLLLKYCDAASTSVLIVGLTGVKVDKITVKNGRMYSDTNECTLHHLADFQRFWNTPAEWILDAKLNFCKPKERQVPTHLLTFGAPNEVEPCRDIGMLEFIPAGTVPAPPVRNPRSVYIYCDGDVDDEKRLVTLLKAIEHAEHVDLSVREKWVRDGGSLRYARLSSSAQDRLADSISRAQDLRRLVINGFLKDFPFPACVEELEVRRDTSLGTHAVNSIHNCTALERLTIKAKMGDPIIAAIISALRYGLQYLKLDLSPGDECNIQALTDAIRDSDLHTLVLINRFDNFVTKMTRLPNTLSFLRVIGVGTDDMKHMLTQLLPGSNVTAIRIDADDFAQENVPALVGVLTDADTRITSLYLRPDGDMPDIDLTPLYQALGSTKLTHLSLGWFQHCILKEIAPFLAGSNLLHLDVLDEATSVGINSFASEVQNSPLVFVNIAVQELDDHEVENRVENIGNEVWTNRDGTVVTTQGSV